MAEIFRVQAKDTVIRFGNYDVLNGVQNNSWDPTFNEEYLEELGSAKYAGYSATPEVSGSFDVTATGATVAILKRMIGKYNATTGAWEGYKAGNPATGHTDYNADNDGKIVPTDLRNAVFDLQEVKQANEAFNRTTLFPRVFLSGMSFSADVNGNASETYSWEGIFVESYRNAYRDLRVVPVTWVDSNTVAVQTAVGGAAPLYTLADYTFVYLLAGDKKIPAANLATSATPGQIDISGGTTVTADQRLMLVMYKTDTTGLTFPTISYPTSARFVKADKINIWLVDPDASDLSQVADLTAHTFTAADKLLRVQNVDVNIDLRNETLRQLAYNSDNTPIFHKEPTYPLNVTCNLSVLEQDLADWAKLSDAADANKLTLGELPNKQWQIAIQYFYGATVVQVIALLDMRVSGRGASVNVGGSAEVSWSFTGSDFVIAGANA